METMNSILEKAADEILASKDCSLISGKAGVAVYYAIKSLEDNQYKVSYNKYIDKAISEMPATYPLRIENGMLGIALSTQYILTYIEHKNADEHLKEIDDLAIKQCNSKNEVYVNISHDSLQQKAQLFFYLTIRLKYGLKKASRREFFIQSTLACMESIYTMLANSTNVELMPFTQLNSLSLFFHGLANLSAVGISNKRIWHILNEMSYTTRIPTLHCNRLSMLYAVKRLISTIDDIPAYWKEYYEMLYTYTSIGTILNTEMKGRQQAFLNGMSGVVFLSLLTFGREYKEKCDITKEAYYQLAFKELTIKDPNKKANTQIAGLNGLFGMKLLYDNFERLQEQSYIF